jgi:hypothetical protein
MHVREERANRRQREISAQAMQYVQRERPRAPRLDSGRSTGAQQNQPWSARGASALLHQRRSGNARLLASQTRLNGVHHG